jgi:ATP-dependent DNA helicase MPH1
MSADDEEDYGDIADEDFIEALSQASQVLPPHPRTSRDVTASGGSDDEEGNGKRKKKKYKIHEGVDEVPKASMCPWSCSFSSFDQC